MVSSSRTARFFVCSETCLLTAGVGRCVQFHARVVLADRLQADAERLRVGSAEQGHRQQPQGLLAVALREGSDAAVRPLPRLLHVTRAGLLEL